VFSTIDDFTTYVDASFAGNSPPKGTNGIYGETFTHVFNNYFNEKGDIALSVSNAVWRTIDMALPTDPVTNKYTLPLMQWFVSAVNSLPPPHRQVPGMNRTTWWNAYEPLFGSFFDKYGTAVVVQASIGGMVQLHTRWDTPLLQRGFTPDQLLEEAKIDWTTTTGLAGGSGTLDAAYKADRKLEFACIGGNPTECTKTGISSGKWGVSTDGAPRLLVYEVVPLSELLDGLNESIKESIEEATEIYMAWKQSHWTALSKCPPGCNGHGTCPKGGGACKCPNFPCAAPFLGRMCSQGGAPMACPIGEIAHAHTTSIKHKFPSLKSHSLSLSAHYLSLRILTGALVAHPSLTQAL
jgi:hypothetical protein